MVNLKTEPNNRPKEETPITAPAADLNSVSFTSNTTDPLLDVEPSSGISFTDVDTRYAEKITLHGFDVSGEVSIYTDMASSSFTTSNETLPTRMPKNPDKILINPDS